jgi:hypothetical protein
MAAHREAGIPVIVFIRFSSSRTSHEYDIEVVEFVHEILVDERPDTGICACFEGKMRTPHPVAELAAAVRSLGAASDRRVGFAYVMS